jgi:hypothetical protein
VIAERRQERAQQIVKSRDIRPEKDAARPARTKCRLKSHLASERLDGGADTANAPLYDEQNKYDQHRPDIRSTHSQSSSRVAGTTARDMQEPSQCIAAGYCSSVARKEMRSSI